MNCSSDYDTGSLLSCDVPSSDGTTPSASKAVIFERPVACARQQVRDTVVRDQHEAQHLAWIAGDPAGGLWRHLAFDEDRSAQAGQHLAIARLAREVFGDEKIELVVRR